MIRRRTLLAASAGVLAAPAILRAQAVQKLTFYYPVAVGGPIAANSQVRWSNPVRVTRSLPL